MTLPERYKYDRKKKECIDLYKGIAFRCSKKDFEAIRNGVISVNFTGQEVIIEKGINYRVINIYE